MKFLRGSSKKKTKDSQKSKESTSSSNTKSLALPTLESSLKPVGSQTDGAKKSEGGTVGEQAPKFSLAAAATAAAVANATGSFHLNSAAGAGIQDFARDSDSERSDVMFEDKSQEGFSATEILKKPPVETAPALAAPFLQQKTTTESPFSPSPAVQLDPIVTKPDTSVASAFRPPIEVTIDPQGIPPSPLRDNTVDFPFQDQSDLLNNNSVDEYRNGNNASPVAQVGAPLGDIGMRTQLWDAQRLVRVILGKPQASEKPLETGSILQAIRAFAVMKQELILLRQQQEIRDGDPPAILETLGSPTNTTQASSTNFRSFSARRSMGGESLSSKESKGGGHKAIIEAAKKIKNLERELQHATVTIHKLQQQNSESNIMQLQQSKLEAQRQLAKIKVDREATQIKLKVSNKDCAEKEKKYQNLLRQFGEFQEFKSREVEGELARKTAQIEELQQKLKEQESSKPAEHASFTAHKAEMEKKLADDSVPSDYDGGDKGKTWALREELEQARLAIKKKDDIIRDLQDSQAQLQNRVSRVLDDLQSRKEGSSSVEDENAPSQRKLEREVDETVLKEVQRNKFSTETTTGGGTPTKATSQRLQSLQEEHRALVATIQLLEEEMKLGT